MLALLKFATILEDDIAAYTDADAKAYKNSLELARKPDSLKLGKKALGLGAGIGGAMLGAKALENNVDKLKKTNPIILGAAAYGAYKGGKKLYTGIEDSLTNGTGLFGGLTQGLDYKQMHYKVNSDIENQRAALRDSILKDSDTMDDLTKEYARNHTFTGKIGNFYKSHNSRVADILNSHNYSPSLTRNVDVTEVY